MVINMSNLRQKGFSGKHSWQDGPRVCQNRPESAPGQAFRGITGPYMLEVFRALNRVLGPLQDLVPLNAPGDFRSPSAPGAKI